MVHVNTTVQRTVCTKHKQQEQPGQDLNSYPHTTMICVDTTHLTIHNFQPSLGENCLNAQRIMCK